MREVLCGRGHDNVRHCEERSDEAIHTCFVGPWIASLRSQ
jgi:hypothetical protein